MTYDSLNSAAMGLLGEATSIASGCNKEFAVCGGWSPFIRNTSRISHPGTRDVDLLFSEGAEKESLKEVVASFLDHGYLVSAKHEFQVLRVLKVKDRDFVFNVDLLHPHEGEINCELFVDQLTLPIPYEDFKSSFVFMKSIALPDAGFVFDGFVENEKLEFRMPSGKTETHSVPIIDEVGLLVTKSKSCSIQKRPRDIFDIYLAIDSPRDKAALHEKLDRLKHKHEGSFASIEYIETALKKWDKWGAPQVFQDRGVDFLRAKAEIRDFIAELGFVTN